jgi:hypothetical protein
MRMPISSLAHIALPHHHLVRVEVNTSILILIVSILLYFLQPSLIVYAIWQFELK